VKKRLIGFMIVALFLLIASAFTQTAPPVGTWATIPNTQLYPAIPFESKSQSAPGGTPELWSPGGIFAYSGADVAQINGVWGFLFWGGGHGDSPDNSLYWDPFDGSGAKRLMGPYLAPDKVYYYDVPLETFRSVSRNAPPTVTVAAAPKSRHTYSSLLRIDLRGQPAVFNYGGSLSAAGGSGTAATRIFDLSQTYAQAMARPDMGWALQAPGPGTAVSSSSGWDPVQKRVVTRSRGFIGAYYPDSDRWENWNIQSAPYGSDCQASVAMDVVGRKMYVLGDRLAEVIDLDTKAYTDLRSKPWAMAFPGVGVGYLAGPGVSWHARTKQIVAWAGGQNLLLIDPVTDVVKTVTMGGATVTAAPGAGTYGRFRVIPGTDQVVLVNAVDQNVFIGTVPFDGVQPTPIPTPTPTPTPTPGPALTGQFLGVTGEDKVGQGSQMTPNGVLDWHLRVQNVTSDPATVRIDAFVNGVSNGRWVSPFNGTNWIIAKTFTASTLDLWFEPYQVPTTFNVTITYGEGTTGSVTGIAGPSTPTPTPTPTPSPGTVAVLPGQPLPLRQWVERPMPPQGQAFMAGGGKHGRAFYHAGLKAMVFAGGDWHTSQPQYEGGGVDGVGSEIWSLDSFNDKWTLQRPFCVPGEPQPGRPDTVGWAYDSLRNRGIMTPGFYFITQGATDPCGSIYGWGAYAFDFATKKFTGPDAAAGVPPPPTGWGGDTGASFATYNPALDEYLRVLGTQLQRLSLAAKTWRVQALSNGNPNWNPAANRAQLVLDVQGQALYWLDVWSSPRALIRITLADGRVTSIPLPASYILPYAGDHEVYLAFDPQSRTILIPNSEGMGQTSLAGLGLYHVDTNQWEWESVPAAVMGSVWGFDEATGALLGIGKRSPPYAYFLYKYR
jgi:hypothetical protein